MMPQGQMSLGRHICLNLFINIILVRFGALGHCHVGTESSCRSVSWDKEGFLSPVAACMCRQ